MEERRRTDSKSHHGVHKLDAALQLWPGVAVLTEQEPTNGLLLTQTGVVPLYEHKRRQMKTCHYHTKHTVRPLYLSFGTPPQEVIKMTVENKEKG